METSDPKAAKAQDAGDDVISAAQETVERIAEKLGASVGASKVYGDPIERGDVTVIPVARARWGFGGGGGRGRRGEPGTGGGGGAVMTPIGYIEIHGDGTTRFRRTTATGDLASIGAVSLLAALAAVWLIRSR